MWKREGCLLEPPCSLAEEGGGDEAVWFGIGGHGHTFPLVSWLFSFLNRVVLNMWIGNVGMWYRIKDVTRMYDDKESSAVSPAFRSPPWRQPFPSCLLCVLMGLHGVSDCGTSGRPEADDSRSEVFPLSWSSLAFCLLSTFPVSESFMIYFFSLSWHFPMFLWSFNFYELALVSFSESCDDFKLMFVEVPGT